jgi:hypothetical protein
MKRVFEFNAAFMNVPLAIPAKESYDKCCFDTLLCHAMINHEVCGFGNKGYFVQDTLAEVPLEEE